MVFKAQVAIEETSLALEVLLWLYLFGLEVYWFRSRLLHDSIRNMYLVQKYSLDFTYLV